MVILNLNPPERKSSGLVYRVSVLGVGKIVGYSHSLLDVTRVVLSRRGTRLSGGGNESPSSDDQ